MKKFWISILVVGFMVNMVFTCNVFAQQEKELRVIEEELVLTDPTVSAKEKWVIGGSYEYWSVAGDYATKDDTGRTMSRGDIEGMMDGGNIFVGYSDWTLQFSYKKGDWWVNQRFENINCYYHDHQEQEETEITMRYLMRGLSSRHFVPYLIAGYNDATVESIKTITTSGWVWSYNSKTVAKFDTKYKSPMLGVGAVIPFNKYLGIRGDIRAAFSDAEKVRDDGTKWTGSGVGSVGHLTGYWNIYKGLNLQVGGKYLYLNGGDAGSYEKVGSFAMFGYSYRF